MMHVIVRQWLSDSFFGAKNPNRRTVSLVTREAYDCLLVQSLWLPQWKRCVIAVNATHYRLIVCFMFSLAHSC